jgi:hypothetical protein
MECSISLNRAGIPTDRLPLKYDGTIKTEDHLQWIAIQEAKESALQQKRTFDVVECPMNMDILSGTLNIPTVTLDLTYVFDCCLFFEWQRSSSSSRSRPLSFSSLHIVYCVRSTRLSIPTTLTPPSIFAVPFYLPFLSPLLFNANHQTHTKTKGEDSWYEVIRGMFPSVLILSELGRYGTIELQIGNKRMQLH